MDRFTLEHRVFLYDCYVKCKSARKCQKYLKEFSQHSSSPQEHYSESRKESPNTWHTDTEKTLEFLQLILYSNSLSFCH
jgi:hypothetical protein